MRASGSEALQVARPHQSRKVASYRGLQRKEPRSTDVAVSGLEMCRRWLSGLFGVGGLASYGRLRHIVPTGSTDVAVGNLDVRWGWPRVVAPASQGGFVGGAWTELF